MRISRRELLRCSLAIAGSVSVSTALSGCLSPRRRPDLSAVSFGHGVASGDPGADCIILWTRAEPEQGLGSVLVAWELAADSDFREVLRSGVVTTDATRDFTVKVDVQELAPGRNYYYRFLGEGGESPRGRARTLSRGKLDSLRLAVFSCANYPAGYFQAYGDAARLADVDAFLHLGDYFYEYGAGGYATERAKELGRDFPSDNAGELFTLTDYRRRYALYRSDEDLQAMHAAAPMIAVWDDHEIANDTWLGGAQNHTPEEGDFAERRSAAVQAYFEWLPLRPLVPDANGRIYRGFDFGDLVSLHMLDTRLIGRDQQLEYGDFVDPDSGRLDFEGFEEALAMGDRGLLGDAQRDWLYQALEQSSAQWQVLGQQTLITRMHFPAPLISGLFKERDYAGVRDLVADLVRDRQALDSGQMLAPDRLQRLRQLLPYNLDAWDGYPDERDRLYAAVRRMGKSLVVLSGDTHNAWFSELSDQHGNPMGVELATPGVSSPGMESYIGLDAGAAEELAGALTVLIDELHYCELSHRGYLEVNFSRSECTARWHFVEDAAQRNSKTFTHSEIYAA